MTNLDSILKSRDITLWMNVLLVKAIVFPVVMYVCKSWTIKKPEHQRIDAFELWCWRRLLRVPWTARRSNLSILTEISPEYSLEVWCWSWSSNTLATWCKELTHLKRPWCWDRLKVGGEGDDRGWDGWMASPTQVNEFHCSCSVAKLYLTLSNPMYYSTPGFPVHHQLLELAQTHVHWVRDAIQHSHPLLSSSPAFSLLQHECLFQWVSGSH